MSGAPLSAALLSSVSPLSEPWGHASTSAVPQDGTHTLGVSDKYGQFTSQKSSSKEMEVLWTHLWLFLPSAVDQKRHANRWTSVARVRMCRKCVFVSQKSLNGDGIRAVLLLSFPVLTVLPFSWSQTAVVWDNGSTCLLQWSLTLELVLIIAESGVYLKPLCR